MNARPTPPPRTSRPAPRFAVRTAVRKAARSARRRGTVIVVVIALLGALMLLGFLFLTLTMQEEQAGIYFAEANDLPAEVDPDVFFNWALEQLIAGPADSSRNSVLYGGYKSLGPNMVGADPTPFDGVGIGTAWDSTNLRPALDLNRNGALDVDEGSDPTLQFALQMTFAPGSQMGGTLEDDATLKTFLAGMRDPGTSGLPAPDADYTYPDLNSAFLSYDFVEPSTGRRVVIPSFHRPQLLRNRVAANDYLEPTTGWTTVGTGADAYQVHPWYTDVATLPFVMRPHLERRAVSVDPENPANFTVQTGADAATRRFVTATHPDRAKVTGGYVDADGALGNVSVDDPTYVPPFDLSVDREPVWRVGQGDLASMDVTAAYRDSYDADPDNDGISDAVWLDLDFPVQSVGSAGGKFVPMWALKVIDVDALFNLNAHGNSYGSYADFDNDGVDDSLQLYGTHFVGTADVPPLSQSGTGLTPDEVNPQYALSGFNTTTSGTAEDFEAFSRFFDLAERDDKGDLVKRGSADLWDGGEWQSRNLEWWFLLHGRTTFKDDPRGGPVRYPDQLLVGRYGEPQRLELGAYSVGRGDPYAAAYFPYPGLSANQTNAFAGGDDNGNAFDGMRRPLPGLVFGGSRRYGGGADGLRMVTPADDVPLDRRGSGRVTDVLAGLSRLFLTDTNAALNVTGYTGAEANVRFRFPTTLNAVVPMFLPGGAGAGWRDVGEFQQIYDYFALASLQDDRNYASRAGTRLENVLSATGAAPAAQETAELTGRGAAAGVLARPDSGATGVTMNGSPLTTDVLPPGQPEDGATAPSLYGAAAGRGDALADLNRLEIDDPGETIRDFDLAQSQREDVIYGPAETARLHMTDADYRIARTESRLLKLAPVSFSKAPGHERIRRRFTTASWDVATAAGPHEPPVPGLRSPGAAEREWERTGSSDPTNTNVRRFPPAFGGTLGDANDPFRAEVRALLEQRTRNAEVNVPADPDAELDAKRVLRRLTRKLSFNAVVERVTNPADPLFDATVGTNGLGEIRLRDLTPHPRNLTADRVLAPIGHPAAATYATGGGTVPRFGVGDEALRTAAKANPGYGLLTWDFDVAAITGAGGNPLAAQEWHARRDRQNLARDLYVLLYTVGGVGTDSSGAAKQYNTTNEPDAMGNRPLYTEDQLREMAQLAVNVVDAMDPDPVRTLFVYDKNLHNGYTVDDDGYVDPPGDADNARGLVAGVEKQQLAIAEVLANVAWAEVKPAGGGRDPDLVEHTLTEWKDTGDADGSPHDFLFVELAYTGPGVLNFARNPATSTDTVSNPGENFRIVVRDPRDKRQFRPAPAAEQSQTAVQARAIIPRAGKVSAARPYYTIANANAGYADFTDPDNTARSRMRVNFRQKKDSVGGVETDQWYTLAPQPFAPHARQVDPTEVLRNLNPGNDAQILDTLAPAPDGAGVPTTFRSQVVNRETLQAQAPGGIDPDPNDLLRFTATGNDRKFDNAGQIPVVEVLLQTRLNPLRQPKAHDPAAGGFDEQERDNPWITIDRMRTVTTRLDLYEGDDNDTSAAAGPPAGAFADHFLANGALAGPITDNDGANETPKLASRVRTEPLLRASELAAIGRQAPDESLLDDSPRHTKYRTVVFNSLGGHDRNSPRATAAGLIRPFALWQPHFDREFVGPADLIGVPLYDAENLTGLTADDDRAFGSGGGSALKKVSFKDFPTAAGERRQLGLGIDPTPQNAQDFALNTQPVLNEFSVAGSRLLYPDVRRPTWQDAVAGGDGSLTYFNGWYRLLQYVGTPRRTSEMVDASNGTVRVGPTARLNTDAAFDVGAIRQTGRINLNTLRHPEVLAGLLDDPRVHRRPNGAPGATVAPLPVVSAALTPAASVGSGYEGDLYLSLMASRDGIDPLPMPDEWGGGPGVYGVLPGIALRGLSDSTDGADGHPFGGFHPPTRSLTGSDEEVSQRLREAMQFTPLRALPGTANWLETGTSLVGANSRAGNDLPRAFFGVGSEFVNAPESANRPADLDFTTRYRLLNKVLNSATHRSNVFLCFMQVDFFHAREIALEDIGVTGAAGRQRLVRIGAKRGDSPRYRGVFLIDRSKLPQLLRADHLPTTGASGENTYSFARDPLSGGVKFPWQELVIHRQRIQ